jgi:hypothetical protein
MDTLSPFKKDTFLGVVVLMWRPKTQRPRQGDREFEVSLSYV